MTFLTNFSFTSRFVEKVNHPRGRGDGAACMSNTLAVSRVLFRDCKMRRKPHPSEDLVSQTSTKAAVTASVDKSMEQEALPMQLHSRVKSRVIRPLKENSLVSGPDSTAVVRDAQVRNLTFASLNVDPWLVASLSALAITRPTGIQNGCIPEILNGRDCIGGSRTGSGKTVAFAVPILQKWAADPFGIFAVVLTPTRCDMQWHLIVALY